MIENSYIDNPSDARLSQLTGQYHSLHAHLAKVSHLLSQRAQRGSELLHPESKHAVDIRMRRKRAFETAHLRLMAAMKPLHEALVLVYESVVTLLEVTDCADRDFEIERRLQAILKRFRVSHDEAIFASNIVAALEAYQFGCKLCRKVAAELSFVNYYEGIQQAVSGAAKVHDYKVKCYMGGVVFEDDESSLDDDLVAPKISALALHQANSLTLSWLSIPDSVGGGDASIKCISDGKRVNPSEDLLPMSWKMCRHAIEPRLGKLKLNLAIRFRVWRIVDNQLYVLEAITSEKRDVEFEIVAAEPHQHGWGRFASPDGQALILTGPSDHLKLAGKEASTSDC
ncbi:MAG TPA: hypothetical protein V6D17_13335 [Candidatus Obscuribacterales bacterium]